MAICESIRINSDELCVLNEDWRFCLNSESVFFIVLRNVLKFLQVVEVVVIVVAKHCVSCEVNYNVVAHSGIYYSTLILQSIFLKIFENTVLNKQLQRFLYKYSSSFSILSCNNAIENNITEFKFLFSCFYVKSTSIVSLTV